MIKAVAEQGYDAVRVRDVVALAGVSTRAFYELFDSKEDCFLRTHEMIVRRAARGIIISQTGEHSWKERIGLVFDELARALTHEPNAVCLATVDAYVAGPTALGQARRAQATFEAMVGETFARAPGGIVIPPMVVEGMVAGIVRLIRSRFISGREQELPRLMDDMREWVLCYPDKDAASLVELDSRCVPVRPALYAPTTLPGTADDDRAIILAAVAKLAAADGYGGLTIPRIRTGAGVSRRKFNARFNGVEDCYLAVVEQRASEAFEEAGRAQIRGRTWAGGIYRAIATLSDRVASDHILTSACLGNDFLPGSRGSRCRKRLIVAIADQLVESVPRDQRPGHPSMEASAGAVWELFRRHVVVASPQQRPLVAATLSYIAMAPVIGPSSAMGAIRQEQAA
jgi:AcrR family transcriptional regulator